MENEIGRISLGCMGMNRGNRESSIRTIDYALDHGVKLLNTGEFYQRGESEIVVGDALRNHKRDDYFISVKFGALTDNKGMHYGLDMNPFNIRAHLTYSLGRLGLDYVDLYEPARMDQSYPVEDVIGEISKLVDEGLVRHIGLTETDAETLRRANAVHPIYMFEKEYSLVDRRMETEGDLATCRELGIPVLAYGLLAHGLLSDRTIEQGTPKHGIASVLYKQEDEPHNIPIVKALQEIAQGYNTTTSNIAIAWALNKNPDMMTLIGTTNPEHLAEAMKATEIKLSEDDIRRIESLFEREKIKGGKLFRMTYVDGRLVKMAL